MQSQLIIASGTLFCTWWSAQYVSYRCIVNCNLLTDAYHVYPHESKKSPIVFPTRMQASKIHLFSSCVLIFLRKTPQWRVRKRATFQTARFLPVTLHVTIPLSAAGQAHAAHTPIYVWTTTSVLHKVAPRGSVGVAARMQDGQVLSVRSTAPMVTEPRDIVVV